VTFGEANAGPISVVALGGRALLASNGTLGFTLTACNRILRTNLSGRFRQLRFESCVTDLIAPPVRGPEPAWVELEALAPIEVIALRIDGVAVPPAQGHPLRIQLPPGDHPTRIELFHSPLPDRPSEGRFG
jgi:hypothetical protein